MRVEAVLHPDVVWDLKHRFTRAETNEFYERLHLVREAPLQYSEPTAEPGRGQRPLSFFRFGRGVEKIAIFEYDIYSNRITVLECRLFKPRRMRKPNANNGGKAARGSEGRARTQ